jgi:hypothetical protein
VPRRFINSVVPVLPDSGLIPTIGSTSRVSRAPKTPALEELLRQPPRPEASRTRVGDRRRVPGGDVPAALAQWHDEATAGGRIWNCIEDDRRIVWMADASVGHPKATE